MGHKGGHSFGCPDPEVPENFVVFCTIVGIYCYCVMWDIGTHQRKKSHDILAEYLMRH